ELAMSSLSWGDYDNDGDFICHIPFVTLPS
ncbi:unnamed protein product, partial [marine sediment metagenome]